MICFWISVLVWVGAVEKVRKPTSNVTNLVSPHNSKQEFYIFIQCAFCITQVNDIILKTAKGFSVVFLWIFIKKKRKLNSLFGTSGWHHPKCIWHQMTEIIFTVVKHRAKYLPNKRCSLDKWEYFLILYRSLCYSYWYSKKPRQLYHNFLSSLFQ